MESVVCIPLESSNHATTMSSWKRPVVCHLLDELTAALPALPHPPTVNSTHGKSLQQINGAIPVNRLAPSLPNPPR